MEENHAKFSINLESEKGLTRLKDFFRQKNIIYNNADEERVLKRLRLTMRKLGLKNYDELLVRFEEDDSFFNDVLNWLEKGEIYDVRDRSFTPLVKRRKTLKDYACIPQRKPKKKRKRRGEKTSSIPPNFDFEFKEPPDPENIKLILNFLSKNDINYEAYKKNYFNRRLLARMKRVEVETYQEYRRYLEKNIKEISLLVNSFSINVTHFFRDKELFFDLEQKILPKIFENNRITKNTRIWSAGCAIGCEPYSISMIIDNLRKKSFESHVFILGTDLSNDFLKRAKSGLYTSEFFKETDAVRLQTYFKKINKEEYQLSPQIRETVTFKWHDLRTSPPDRDFDLILCRNVLIYFSRSQSETLFKRFHSVLKPNGYLVIGKCELLNQKARDRFETIDPSNRIYRRLD
ncbi:MAG: CheR family methyltransferase [Candidatus Hodarchaeota archaeon]